MAREGRGRGNGGSWKPQGERVSITSCVHQHPNFVNECHTNNPAIIQLPSGKLSMPFCLGRVNMMYRRLMKPGASMVAHAILPGMLNRELTDVFPCG